MAWWNSAQFTPGPIMCVWAKTILSICCVYLESFIWCSALAVKWMYIQIYIHVYEPVRSAIKVEGGGGGGKWKRRGKHEKKRREGGMKRREEC